MKVNEFYVVESDHFEERKEERGISMREIEYMLRDKMDMLRLYKNIDSELVIRHGGASIMLDVHFRTIVLITALDKSAERVTHGKVI